MSEVRANPDELLSYVQQEESKEKRGKLKIFFGAAPGVGKTYAMLQDAIQKRNEGLDVLVGVVESHGRKETQQLLNQLEQLPPKQVPYKDKFFEEFDLDAAIARHPAVLLVDEMAHTNAPNSRHEKRWQDIKELIERGIDVYTALNVQHIESLNDIVAQITGVRVRETVPDSILELVDNIELVDLSPDDLLQRLKEGKIYIPEQAQLAVDKFFRKSNLVALRELALRLTAEKVNTELLAQRRGQLNESVWPTTERLLVCVGPGVNSTKLVRAARRLASKLQAEWIAVYVEAPRLRLSEDAQKSAIANLRLAEQLGAETMILSDGDMVKAIISCAKTHNVSKIVVGKQIRPRWRDIVFGSLVDELVRHSEELDIYIIQDDEGKAQRPGPWLDLNIHSPISAYTTAMLYVFIATIINFFLYNHIGTSNLIMIYLLTVIAVAVRGQRGPSTLASLLSVFLYNFCFLSPRYTLAITNAQYIVTLLVMLLVAQIISHLTIVKQESARAARRREQRTSQLLGLSRQLAHHRGVDSLLNIAVRYIGEIFVSEVMALLPNDEKQLQVKAVFGMQQQLSAKEQSVAQWSYDLKQMAGLGTQTLPFSEALYVPLIGTQMIVGVLHIKPKEVKQFLLPENMHALEACVRQIAFALEVDLLK